jgi:DnaJ-class molecular chaperone
MSNGPSGFSGNGDRASWPILVQGSNDPDYCEWPETCLSCEGIGSILDEYGTEHDCRSCDGVGEVMVSNVGQRR